MTSDIILPIDIYSYGEGNTSIWDAFHSGGSVIPEYELMEDLYSEYKRMEEYSNSLQLGIDKTVEKLKDGGFVFPEKVDFNSMFFQEFLPQLKGIIWEYVAKGTPIYFVKETESRMEEWIREMKEKGKWKGWQSQWGDEETMMRLNSDVEEYWEDDMGDRFDYDPQKAAKYIYELKENPEFEELVKLIKYVLFGVSSMSNLKLDKQADYYNNILYTVVPRDMSLEFGIYPQDQKFHSTYVFLWDTYADLNNFDEDKWKKLKVIIPQDAKQDHTFTRITGSTVGVEYIPNSWEVREQKINSLYNE